MSNRELLELAAKAAGIKGFRYVNNEPIQGGYRTGLWSDLYEDCWDPLTNDGDALRLAVQLRLVISSNDVTVMVYEPSTMRRGEVYELVGADPYSATRRAITRAAAEIGRTTI